jgi:hypothetical protein
MHTEDSRWEEYERRFRALAERVPVHKGARAELASARLILCLYGDNGLSPESELDVLTQLEQAANRVQGVEMTTAYWEDLVLYLP